MPIPYYADIILPLPLARAFTYRIPEQLMSEIEKGKRVIVQFGKKKYYTGIVYHIHPNKPVVYETKEIFSVVDTIPVIDENQLKLWDWISEYYACSKGEVMKAALPAGFKLESETTVSLYPDIEYNGKLEEKELLIIDLIEKKHLVSIKEIEGLTGSRHTPQILQKLLEKRIIAIEEYFNKGYRPKLETFVSISGEYNSESSVNKLFDKLSKAPKQLNLLIAYISLSGMLNNKKPAEVKKSILMAMAKSGDQAFNALVKKGIFQIYKKQTDRINIPVNELQPLKELNLSQLKALEEIHYHFNNKNVILLHGITSSGKTEIYIHLINEIIQKGQQCLYLLPEIALTSQIISRLRNVFGDKTAVYHSKFSDNEKVEIYNRVKKGNGMVILGVRSSVFLPFKNLGLVIVDEEHENTFKQFDPNPRYNARDTAIILARYHGAKTLLGTATPSLESYFNVKTGKYGFVELTERYLDIRLPEIIIADVKEARLKKQMKSIFTPMMLENIEKALADHEQIILFQNRRGFSPYLECTACGWIPYCKNCDVSLTYHKHLNRLICHYCGYSHPNPPGCMACGSITMETRGFGTEKIEDELAIFFPTAKVSRMDIDTTRTKDAHEKIITRFEQQKIDILVGTQMITKGLDFDNVSLVGILDADSMLNFPDFRAHERSFQLMMQVSGRAGRKFKQGKVIIQTTNPKHKIIQQVLNNDYAGFSINQLKDRKEFRYPPFYRLIEVTLKHKKPEVLDKASDLLKKMLVPGFGKMVLGPQAPVIGKVQSWYLKQFIIKIEKEKSHQQVKNKLSELVNRLKSESRYSTLQVAIDVDPM